MARLLTGAFCGDDHAFDFTPTDVPNINNIKLYNGIYDDLYVSRNGQLTYDETSKEWDFDTVLYALFQNNLFAGNVNFTADTVSAMRVKRRKKGTYTWDTIFEIPIRNNDDFSFERFDRFVRANTDYEYSLVPMIDSVEGNLNTNEVHSEFDGFYLVEKDVVYQAILNAKIPNTSRNHNGTIITTLGKKKPFYITNGDANYTQGVMQATFIDIGLDCNFDIENGWKFREQVNDFLTNGKPKILKNDEGKMWLVAIIDPITENEEGHFQNVVSNFTWVELGDPENIADLVDAGLLTLDPRLVR